MNFFSLNDITETITQVNKGTERKTIKNYNEAQGKQKPFVNSHKRRKKE